MELHITRPNLVVPVPADPEGIRGPTPGRARGPYFRTTSPNRFVPVEVAADAAWQRIVEAVAGAPDGSAATGWSALNWQHARWFEGNHGNGEPKPVLLAVGDAGHLAERAGVSFCYDWLFDDDIIAVDGMPITRPERSVCVAVLRARTLSAAVQIIDMALYSDLVSLTELRAYAARIKGRPHTRRLNAAIELADENVWSPMESDMRLRWLDAQPGARLLCNRPIFDADGKHLLTPDLLDPHRGLLGEYNGVIHDGTPARRRDLNREELCRALDLEVVTMMSTDLRDARSFEHRLAAAHQRRSQRPGPARRLWTLTQPGWWVDTSTVERRRALSELDRQTWLRHRSA